MGNKINQIALLADLVVELSEEEQYVAAAMVSKKLKLIVDEYRSEILQMEKLSDEVVPNTQTASDKKS